MKGRRWRPWENGKCYGKMPSGWDAYADWEKWINDQLSEEMQEAVDEMDTLLRINFYSIMCALCDKGRGEG